MKKFSSRSIIAILFVIGFFVLALVDVEYRQGFVNLAFTCIGGYFGHLFPKQPPKQVIE